MCHHMYMATGFMDEMLCNVIIWMCVTLCLTNCTTDLCNWTAAPQTEKTQDWWFRCGCCAGGWVRWVYPGQQALRVVLKPNLFYALRSTVCIKPSPSLCGTNVFIERSGQLKLLSERPSQGEVICFRADEAHGPVIYLQASVQSKELWGRCMTGFRYEVLTNRKTVLSLDHRGLEESCQPCNNTELLVAICNSDFVVRGFIKNISHDSVRQISSVQVSLTRVYRQQHSGLFERHAAPHRPSMSGNIYTLLQCHIKSGHGEFLFTGSEHFGRAWLGCAPRFKDFLSMYHSAQAARYNPCDFPLD